MIVDVFIYLKHILQHSSQHHMLFQSRKLIRSKEGRSNVNMERIHRKQVVKTCHLAMVVRCAIGTCGNTKKRNKNLSFHELPLVYYWREEWKKIINLNGGVHGNSKENGGRSFCVCSEHFTPDSYKPSGHRRLKEDAVPSIFSSSHRKRPQPSPNGECHGTPAKSK
jgi:THAP domain